MTDDIANSSAAAGSDNAASENSDSPDTADNDNIQSLTDLFDEMDRAAFKRALANRDAQRSGDAKPRKLQRG